MCGGSTSVNYPGPTPQEQQLEQLQLTQLQHQSDMMNNLEPFMLQSMGLQKNADGSYAYTPEQQAMNDAAKANASTALQLQQQSEERQKEAMAGTLPLSTQLEQQKQLDFNALKETQASNGNDIMGDTLDNAVAKTTSGQQALESMQKVYANAANTEMNNVIQGQAQNPAEYGSLYQSTRIGSNPAAGGMNALASVYAPLGAEFSSAYSPYVSSQQMQLQAGMTNASNNQSFQNTLLSGLLNGGARVAGAYAGGGTGA